MATRLRSCPLLRQSTRHSRLSPLVVARHASANYRRLSTSPARFSVPDPSAFPPPTLLRNIGIMAHIDGGKTTLTESLLHLSGLLPRGPGSVDEGTTQTDFLPAERERGITIQSASVPLVWKDTRINLIDTPGHVDFAVEVERAVRVLDGGVVVLDGVEGVEAQTEGIWRQAKRYNLSPLLLFVNKLDRPGASFARSLQSTLQKLHPAPLALQLPVPHPSGDGISGLIDLVDLTYLTFPFPSAAPPEVSAMPPEWVPEAHKARTALVETLSSLDEVLVEEFFALEGENPHIDLSADTLRASLRRLTHEGRVLPVLCGSALKGVGVAPLLDAVVDYLPNPTEIAPAVGQNGEIVPMTDEGCVALAFKVVWDARKGWMTWVRVYSGTLSRTTTLHNTSTGVRERISKLMLMSGERSVEVPALPAGHIGVLLGLKDTRTGDTLLSASDPRRNPPAPLKLKNITIPPPVFSVAIEPESLADEKPVALALRSLLRTDPSLVLTEPNDAAAAGGEGQTLLSGLGELHLEISFRRLLEEFNVRARMGRMRVGYRESVEEGDGAQVVEMFERELAGTRVQAGVTVAVRRLREDEVGDPELGGNIVHIDTGDIPPPAPPPPAAKRGGGAAKPARPAAPPPESPLREPILSGLLSTMSRGPLSTYPLHSLHITASNPVVISPELSPPAAIAAGSAAALGKAVKAAGSRVLEPIMDVRIRVGEASLGRVVSELTSVRNGMVLSLGTDEDQPTSVQDAASNGTAAKIYIPRDLTSAKSSFTDGLDVPEQKRTVHAHVPLSQMVDYASKLRALSGGAGTFDMAVHGFGEVSPERERAVLEELGRSR